MVINGLHLSCMFEFKVALFIPILIYFVIHLTSSVFKKSIYSKLKKKKLTSSTMNSICIVLCLPKNRFRTHSMQQITSDMLVSAQAGNVQ